MYVLNIFFPSGFNYDYFPFGFNYDYFPFGLDYDYFPFGFNCYFPMFESAINRKIRFDLDEFHKKMYEKLESIGDLESALYGDLV